MGKNVLGFSTTSTKLEPFLTSISNFSDGNKPKLPESGWDGLEARLPLPKMSISNFSDGNNTQAT